MDWWAQPAQFDLTPIELSVKCVDPEPGDLSVWSGTVTLRDGVDQVCGPVVEAPFCQCPWVCEKHP